MIDALQDGTCKTSARQEDVIRRDYDALMFKIIHDKTEHFMERGFKRVVIKPNQ